jgi:hypothetical protein
MNPRDLLHPVKVGLALCLGIILHSSCLGQCATGATRTYDTALASTGFEIYSLTFPQFSPDSGTLISVKLSTQTSSQYGFTLQNQDVTNASYSLSIGQEDQFSGAALSSPFTALTSQYVGAYSLTPGQSITVPPFTFLHNNVTSNDSITTDVTPFLGAGQVNLSFMSFTYTNLTSYNNATYGYSVNISNTMKVSLQYLYCNEVVLATALTGWSAQLTAPETVLLTWSAADEPSGRQYNIQRSNNGQDFTTIATVAGDGAADYRYTDQLPAGASGNIYYRLAISDAGSLSWSPVRVVHVLDPLTNEDHVLRVYPNPAVNYIDLATGQTASDWQIEIFGSGGSLLQRETRLQSADLHIPLSNMAAGVYFVRAFDLRAQRSYTVAFVVNGRP